MDKEEEINRKIEMLKRKNEALMQRHKEVEADKKSAEKSGQSFKDMAPYPDHQRTDTGNARKGSGSHSRAHMDEEDHEDSRYIRRAPRNSRGRGDYHEGRGDTQSGRRTPRGRGRGRRSMEYEAKRMENYRLMEEEMAQAPEDEEGGSRFLDDPRRKGDLEPDDRWKSTRHKGNYGGMEFENVKRGMRGRGRGGYHRTYRGRGRDMSKLEMSAEFTGRERQDRERWKAMREAADKEIMARSKNTEGKWRREWDAEKEDEFNSKRSSEPGRDERYEESRRNHRGRGGRGRRGSNRGRRGSRSSHGSTENGNEQHDKEDNKQDLPPKESSDKEKADEKMPNVAEEPIGESSIPQPQRQKKKQSKSPMHLMQQRAQTPSSKDGTEVWAQNSHHSDETKAEWKNGANRSGEQWLPSNEGNRNPAIDERMLEQQEDGATVYSQQLGRGWGSEKNIKATKAWVIDTEKAGALNQKPVDSDIKDSSEVGHRKFDQMHMGRRRNRKEEELVREMRNERTEARSASPRLKRGNPGLTVEINSGGNTRRVKRYSEGDSRMSTELTNVGDEKEKTCPASKDNEDDSDGQVKSPLSAGVLKTPEGLKHVDDWAAEMDLLSPTYEKRQKEIEEALAKAQSDNKTETVSNVNKSGELPEDSKDPGSVQAEIAIDNQDESGSVEKTDVQIDSTNIDLKCQVDSTADVVTEDGNIELAGAQSNKVSVLESESDVQNSNDIKDELVDNVEQNETKLSKDEICDNAQEDVDEEFFECDEDNEQPSTGNESKPPDNADPVGDSLDSKPNEAENSEGITEQKLDTNVEIEGANSSAQSVNDNLVTTVDDQTTSAAVTESSENENVVPT